MKELKFHGQKIITGCGSINYVENIYDKNVFIVTGGNSTFKNGFIDKLKNILENSKSKCYIYSGVKKNPDINQIIDGISKMKEFKPQVVIGIGGGSAIDAAKLMALLYEYPEFDIELLPDEKLPEERKSISLIAIPSTSGTATEVTKTSVITFKDKNIKIGLKTPALVPDIAILDPEITLSMPKNIIAETGMDAVTHAVECYINNSIDDFTGCIAADAAEGLVKYLPLSYETDEIKYKEKVHNFQCMAGCAFGNVGLGMGHGISHSIGGKFDLGHGLINAIVLPYILEYNSKDAIVAEKLLYLSKRLNVNSFIDTIKELNKRINIPKSFKEININEGEYFGCFDEIVNNALKGSTRSNPIVVSENDMQDILKKIYYGN